MPCGIVIFLLSQKWYYIRLLTAQRAISLRRSLNITAKQYNSPKANITEKERHAEKRVFLFLVRVTGLDPAATSCGFQKLLSAWGAGNFWPLRLFKLASSRTASARSQSLTFVQEPAVSNFIIQMKNPEKAKTSSGFLVRVTGLEPAASWPPVKRATSCATPGY